MDHLRRDRFLSATNRGGCWATMLMSTGRLKVTETDWDSVECLYPTLGFRTLLNYKQPRGAQ
jgi:hypothetical protein